MPERRDEDVTRAALPLVGRPTGVAWLSVFALANLLLVGETIMARRRRPS